MKRSLRKMRHLALASAVVGVASSRAQAQIATLDKGHSLIITDGLQILGADTDTRDSFSYSNLTGANLTGVFWGFPAVDYSGTTVSVLSAGQKWGKEVDYSSSPDTIMSSTENAHKSDMTFVQVGDEQQGDIESANSVTANWFETAQAHNDFPNQILYTNSFFINSDAAYANFIATANPDAISFDSYPFSNPAGYYITPTNWLSLASHFRAHGLGSYIGATGNAPRPYGMFVQTFHDSNAINPGEAEIRWQQFTAWTMGYSFVDAFIYDGGNTDFASKTDGGLVYNYFAETARQGRNIGPALTHLISYGSGTSIIPGKNSDGSGRGAPGGWLNFAQGNAPGNQRYLTGVSATNPGSKNGGQPGDVYVGFFNPLLSTYGNQTGENYFMVTNGLGGDLTLPSGSADNTATVAQCAQTITLTFNLAGTGITSLQRVRRTDGVVETVPLTSLGGGSYQYTFSLDGGTGDLFKFNDGAPFVGVQSLAASYWDGDSLAANNNTATGASMGGSGTWDSASTRWYNSGSLDSSWTSGRDAIFWGSAGTVTLASAQTATSLTFKTTGYNVTGSTLTLAGSFINVDNGVTATIGSTLAGSLGIVKTGGGTLNLAAANTYTGGTTINGGILSIGSSSLGANPASPIVNVTINNGSTLRFNVSNLTLTANRNFQLGDGGAIIDTNGFNDTIAGVITGSGFNKIGNGTLALTGSSTYTSGTTISGGTLLISSDANLGAAPSSRSANIDIEGGTLQFAANLDINSNRVITLGTAGGTIDTNGFSTINGYGIANSFQGGNLTKTGAGTFFASATTNGLNTLWTGNLIIKQGTWEITATDGLPYNPVGTGLIPAQVTLDGGTWQFAANRFATNPNRGITVNAGGGTIDTQNFNVTWAGPISGTVSTATLTKLGSGNLCLNSSTNSQADANLYSGNILIAGGSLQLDGGTAIGTTVSISLANTAGANLTLTNGGETLGSLAGGGSSGGNVNINANDLTVGGNGVSTTFAGAISGTGHLIKTGPGTLVLTGANTYSGATTISAGILQIGDNTTTGSVSSNIVDNTLLKFARSDNLTYSGSISGAGSLIQSGPGTLCLSTAETYTGGTTIAGGTLAIKSPSSTGTGPITISNASLQLAAPMTLASALTINGTATIDTAGNNSTYNGSISTSGNLIKSGLGKLTVTNVRTAGLTVSSGTLAIASGGGTAGTSVVNSLSVGGTLDLTNHSLIVNYSGASPINSVRAALASAYDNGHWDGAGITSSTAATDASGNTAVGYAEASDLGITSFAGQHINGNAVLVKYTYYGDQNLDGVCNLDDFSIFIDGFNGLGSGWLYGDFNYDGVIDQNDFSLFVKGFNLNGQPLSELASAVLSDPNLSAAQKSAMLSVVPEPTMISILAMAPLLCRRRKLFNAETQRTPRRK